MTLEEFAKDAGVKIVDCGKGWGGKIGYKEDEFPNHTTCGFKTEKAAYKSWFEDRFGKQTAKAILKLLKKAQEK
jgi:hypothetical protein